MKIFPLLTGTLWVGFCYFQSSFSLRSLRLCEEYFQGSRTRIRHVKSIPAIAGAIFDMQKTVAGVAGANFCVQKPLPTSSGALFARKKPLSQLREPNFTCKNRCRSCGNAYFTPENAHSTEEMPHYFGQQRL